jgi:hypothetical protein
VTFGIGNPLAFLGAAPVGSPVTLFDRAWTLTVGTSATDSVGNQLAIQTSGGGTDGIGHDIAFKVEKSLKPEPNKCSIKVWNLNEEQRAGIEELNPITDPVSSLLKKKQRITARKQATTGIPCKLEVGYATKTNQIWLGDLRHGESKREGTDWVTEIASGDGEKAWQNARIHVSYGAGTTKAAALSAIINALGLGAGNSAEAAAALAASTNPVYLQGAVISGDVATELTSFCKAAELEWSIQDGTVQIIDMGSALAQEALYISEDTGMVESPNVDVDGILTVKTLLLPDVRCGRLITLDAADVKGVYRIEKAVWEGDTAGAEWGITLTCRVFS